ncbi:HNH endonuclease [Photobacterium profundum]|uniref:HNH endonuclease n=1 Tax=Photobacterium profundum TaxID=74109 RepID=UPI003D0B3DE5
MKTLKPRITKTLDPSVTRKNGNRSATARTYGGKWQRIRKAVLTDEPLCRLCLAAGITQQAMEVDHIIPLYLGGTDEKSNLQPLCFLCHQFKTTTENTLRNRDHKRD